MALLIFKVGTLTIATSEWTVQSLEHEASVEVWWGQSVVNSTFFPLTMDQFLARKFGDIIDLRDLGARDNPSVITWTTGFFRC